MTKKQVLRGITAVLLVITAVVIVIFAVLNAVTASAEPGKLPIYCVDRTDSKIALTFDCAWGNSNTDSLIEILKAAGAKATFFVTGEFCDKYPEDIRKLYNAGHSIQNHSDRHPHVKGMNINDLIEDTRECSRKINMITGKEPTLYRAPYGEYDDTLMTTIEGMGLKVIQWSVDSIDWEDPDPATIRNRILDKTETGSILLFHNDLENTEQALPSLLTELKQKGFEFAAVEDMIYTENYTIDNTGKQIYQPAAAAADLIVYSDNPYLDSAFEKIRRNLTLRQIYELSSAGKIELIPGIRDLLTSAEIYAFQHASYEELYDAYTALVFAAESYGAGGALVTEPAETQPPVTTVPEETTPPPVSYDEGEIKG